MSDYRDLLEQERRKHVMRDGTVEGLERRRNRKRQNGQILAGAVALLIAAAGVGGGLYAFRGSEGRPAVSPSITPSVRPSIPTSSPRLTSPPVSGPIQFIDDQHRWIVDGADQILATADRGRSWAVQFSGPSNIRAIAFLDAHHGWGVGEGGLIWTTDGVHWEPWSNQALSSIQFVTPQVGWGVEARQARDRPALPLRNLLRDGLILGGEQVPNRPNGSWRIVRSPIVPRVDHLYEARLPDSRWFYKYRISRIEGGRVDTVRGWYQYARDNQESPHDTWVYSRVVNRGIPIGRIAFRSDLGPAPRHGDLRGGVARSQSPPASARPPPVRCAQHHQQVGTSMSVSA
jgi:hypothetical protein